ncbi:hypothetical protein WJX81_003988 [Elliptochloris bilobata]|uniref:E3 ubiquitin protein ligase n=1 Tax=Elliptochloris bilobata TaxID=381761 RepID=A0AAW1RE75_9CHLO
MLAWQNATLSAQLGAQRKQVDDLEAKVDEAEKKQNGYVETLACVDRLWRQLNADVAFLAARACTGDCDAAECALSISAEPPQPCKAGNGQVETEDPFLERLLRGGDDKAAALVRAQAAEIRDESTDVEAALAARSAGTSAALARLVDAIDAARARSTAAAEHAAQPNGADAEDGKLQGALREAAAARRAADAQKAVNRVLQERVGMLEDQCTKDDRVIRDLRNDAADRAEELAATQRKLFALRDQNDAAGVLSPAAPSLGAPRRSLGPPRDSAAGGGGGGGGGGVAAEAAAAEAAAAAAEAAEAMALLEKRTAELDAEREAGLRLQRELRDLQASVATEANVAGSRLYAAAQAQVAGLQAELARAHAQAAEQARIQEAVYAREGALRLQAEAGEHAKRRLALAEAALAEQQRSVSAAQAERHAAELAAHAELQRRGHPQTVADLAQQAESLSQEVRSLRGRVSRDTALEQAAAAARAEARSAAFALQTRELELQRLKEQVASSQADAHAAQRQQAEEKSRADDLRLFVEVLTEFCKDPRDVVESRAGEARARQQLAEAQRQLEAAGVQAVEERIACEKAAAAEAAAAQRAECDALRLQCADLQREIADLRTQLCGSKEDCEAYLSELTAMGEVNEKSEAEVVRLIKQQRERDEQAAAATGEAIRLRHAAERATAERDAAVSIQRRAERAAAVLQERVGVLEAQLQAAGEEVARVRERGAAAAAAAEASQREAAAAAEAVRAAEAGAAEARCAVVKRSRENAEEADRAARERHKRQRLEEDLRAATGQLERLRRGSASDAAEQELMAMRKMLRCSVCQERQKDAVITKCWHVFCYECIKLTHASRNRKCPGCSSRFGMDDVQRFYLA